MCSGHYGHFISWQREPMVFRSGDRWKSWFGNPWRPESYQPSQVLDCGDEQELLGSTSQASEPESAEPQVLLHVSEQHLDFPSQPT